MRAYALTPDAAVAFPRFFNIGGVWINSYKVFLIVGIYVGSVVSAVLAAVAGSTSPLAVGLAAMTCALMGMIGARVYHLVVNAARYRQDGSWRSVGDPRRGGWSVFGALLTFVPASVATAFLVGVPVAVLWDFMSGGVLAGGFWIRLGCVFNGCCVGRETRSWFGVCLHDVSGARKRRIPAQFLEMACWLAGTAIFMTQWPERYVPGTYALGVLGGYGAVRFVLEPWREQVDVVFGRVPINRVIAAGLAAGSAVTLLLRGWRP
jgi:phosphatidylglycerol---prolipoprotein diacylglyceryl transferase